MVMKPGALGGAWRSWGDLSQSKNTPVGGLNDSLRPCCSGPCRGAPTSDPGSREKLQLQLGHLEPGLAASLTLRAGVQEPPRGAHSRDRALTVGTSSLSVTVATAALS